MSESIKVKVNPAKLPKPKLPPTKAVDIGYDKNSYIPNIRAEYPKPQAEPDKKGWTQRDERLLRKLKLGGMKDKDIAKNLGRTLYSVKWKIKEMRKAGAL